MKHHGQTLGTEYIERARQLWAQSSIYYSRIWHNIYCSWITNRCQYVSHAGFRLRASAYKLARCLFSNQACAAAEMYDMQTLVQRACLNNILVARSDFTQWPF